jgi:protein gp37
MAKSSIEWTEATWNPVTGCTKISAGCKNCYAERMARRLQAMGQPNYRNGFRLTLHEQALDLPRRWRKPQVVFVNSMSDLFHRDVPLAFLQRVFAVMQETARHRFQVLTKRADRLRALAPLLAWPDNVWMGVSVESDDHRGRIDDLRATPAAVKFLSLEPLLGPLPALDLHGIDWVIVGGESGPRARPMDPAWVRELRDHCVAARVPFFFKQWGGVWKNRTGRVLDGRTWDQMPNQSCRDRFDAVLRLPGVRPVPWCESSLAATGAEVHRTRENRRTP